MPQPQIIGKIVATFNRDDLKASRTTRVLPMHKILHVCKFYDARTYKEYMYSKFSRPSIYIYIATFFHYQTEN